VAIRKILTISVWSISILCVATAGLIAAMAVLIAQTFEPTEMILEQNIEPWTDALTACAGFALLFILTAVNLRLWHSVRFPVAGLILTAAEAGCVAWACVWVYKEYL
jgi:hypothetical protein